MNLVDLDNDVVLVLLQLVQLLAFSGRLAMFAPPPPVQPPPTDDDISVCPSANSANDPTQEGQREGDGGRR